MRLGRGIHNKTIYLPTRSDCKALGQSKNRHHSTIVKICRDPDLVDCTVALRRAQCPLAIISSGGKLWHCFLATRPPDYRKRNDFAAGPISGRSSYTREDKVNTTVERILEASKIAGWNWVTRLATKLQKTHRHNVFASRSADRVKKFLHQTAEERYAGIRICVTADWTTAAV